MVCGGCSNLLVQVVLKLHERMSLTRGQIAVAAELLARESFEGKKAASVTEAITTALNSIGLEGRVEATGKLYRVELLTTCPLREMCPLPFFVAASVREMTGERIYAVTEEGKVVSETNGHCVFSLKAA